MGSQMIFSLTILLLVAIFQSGATLNPHYYDETCPQAELIIDQVVREAAKNDPKVPARLLRMFFHDCFIRGCDASVMLDSTTTDKAEKDGPPNISLAAFGVIDNAKAKLEAACPGTVSCADILAIAAKDVVVLSGGPDWSVFKGRKDGNISRASETINLPAPSFNASQLIQSFSQRGLALKDLVALVGGHTLGFSHCSSFSGRLRNFSPTQDSDPTLDLNFASDLRKTCPINNTDRNAGQFLDSTSAVFDNDYFIRVIQGKGVFVSDQSLFSDQRTGPMVEAFARDQSLFFREFSESMVRLGNVGVTENGEVRRSCRVVN
ncbi:peroxidase 66 [Phtheirospermum japonicum]|uniref:Peroxidase n=1 Tax=Phtheirospermum japonicum TaxID=374723 RepID=A0A830BCS3_9LAMI|nr:peroxidase 66 [Phtheirospermum japonicum]